MSNILTSFLSDVAGGLFADSGYLRDYQHAARLYVDSYYGMAPKAGWSYFIEFGLNPNMASGQAGMFKALDEGWYNKSRAKIGLIAKTADLPRFTIGHSVLNQYNKKTVIQNKIVYQPVTITFHDDMDNMTTNLWKNYYQYYYADSRYSPNLPNGSKTLAIPEPYQDTYYTSYRTYNYGLNNGQDEPFFKYIKIFLLNKRTYNSITLINPLITEWSHSQLDNSQTKMLDNKMTISYEAVFYDTAKRPITKTDPGFNNLPYDNTKSPLRAGRGGGLSGLLGGTGDFLGNVAEGLENGFTVGSIISLAKDANNLKKNYDEVKRAGKRGLIQEAYSIAGSVFQDAAKGRGAYADSGYVNKVFNTPLNTSFYVEQVPLYQKDPNTGQNVYENGQLVPYKGAEGTTQRQSLFAVPKVLK